MDQTSISVFCLYGFHRNVYIIETLLNSSTVYRTAKVPATGKCKSLLSTSRAMQFLQAITYNDDSTRISEFYSRLSLSLGQHCLTIQLTTADWISVAKPSEKNLFLSV